jgi:cell division FtsZ-interacting protein ZapD
MNETPRTDSVWEHFSGYLEHLQCAKRLSKNLELELADATEELMETQKDYNCLAELLDGHDATECRSNLVRLKEQRDALEAVLKMYGLDVKSVDGKLLIISCKLKKND